MTGKTCLFDETKMFHPGIITITPCDINHTILQKHYKQVHQDFLSLGIEILIMARTNFKLTELQKMFIGYPHMSIYKLFDYFEHKWH